MNAIKKILPIFPVLGSNLFFVFAAIFAYEYLGIENSLIYVIYTVTIAFLSIAVTIYIILVKNIKINMTEFVFLWIPIIVTILYLKSIMKLGYVAPLAKNFYIFFLLWSTPAIYIAIYIKKMNLFFELIKWFEIAMILYTLGIFTTTILPFLSGQGFDNFAGATYQSASYVSAVAFGYNLYFIFLGGNHERYSVFKHKNYRLLQFFLLLIQIGGIFISGGRGGIVLALMYTLYIVYLVIRSYNFEKSIKNLTIIFVFIFIIILITNLLLPSNPIFARGFNRVFQFIGTDFKINWGGTSGRDVVYSNAINLIKLKPISGYGFFSYLGYVRNPHNFLLEWLLQGGILFCLMGIIMLFLLLYKMIKLIQIDSRYRFVVIIIMYPLIMLIFSGTYIVSSDLWFSITFLFLNSSFVLQRCVDYEKVY